MPCSSRWESHLSASMQPPVRNTREANFKKLKTSSYGLCILKVMLQESWPRVCLHRTVGQPCQRCDLWYEPVAPYWGCWAWLRFHPCTVSTLGKAQPSTGMYVPFWQQSDSQRTLVRQNGNLKMYQPIGSNKTKPCLLHNYLLFSCSAEVLFCMLSALTTSH